MKIALIGWYGKKNAGDEALKCVLEDFFSEFEIHVFGIQSMNEELLNKFQEMDFIIIGGGGVFNYGSPAPFNNATEWLDKIKAQVIILSVGVTCPIYGPNEQKNLRFLLERCAKVSVRDHISKFELERVLPIKQIDIIPDLGILLNSHPFKFDKGEGIYTGVCLRQKWWRNVETAARKIAETLDKAYENSGLKFVFIPFSTREGIEDDRIINKMIISYLKHDCYINIETELSPEEIKYLLSKMDLVIGMRLHSLILAASEGVPVIGINYFTKIRRFMETIGQENFVIDLGEIQTEYLYNKINDVLHKKDETSRNIDEKIIQMKKDLLEYLLEIKQEMVSGKIMKTIQFEEHTSIVENDFIGKYEGIISKNPYHIGAYIQLGIEYEKSGDFRKAIELYIKAISLEENNLIAHYLLSRIYYKLGDSSNAAKELRTVIDLDGIHQILSIGYEEGHQINLRNLELTATLQSKNSEIEALQRINLENQEKFKNSITWQTVMKFESAIQRLLPQGTKRRKIYDSALMTIRNIALGENKNSPKKNMTYIKKNEIINVPSKIENKLDIFCFPIINWDFRFQRPQQLLSRFANDSHRVFYLTIDLMPLDENFKIRTLAKNVFELNLNALTHFNIYKDVWDPTQLKKLIESIDFVKNSLNIEAVSIVDFPSWAPVVFRLKELYGWKIIYDCMDEHTGFSNIDKKRVQEEEKLLRNSDLLIITSMYLNKKARKYRNNNILLLPNAGDFNHFNNLKNNKVLQVIKKPIIGYYGAIAEWFDNELIEYIANERKAWNFVFIGRTFGSKIDNLQKFSNVHFLEEKEYSELPKYLYWFDVCIIPFKIIPLIEATHPVKFYEYLSSGKPVVSTMLPELMPYSDLCYLAKDNEDFLKKVEIALMENDLEIKNKRIDFARNNTWDTRYDILISHIEELINHSKK